MNRLYEQINDALAYDPETGLFIWKHGRGKVKAGSVAGNRCSDRGYIRITVNYKSHKASRLAWLLHYGELPSGEVDHINHVRDDNRIKNLRCVSRAENAKNLSLRKDNSSGLPGVRWHKGTQKWQTRIKVGGRYLHLYQGRDLFEACCRRKAAELNHNFHQNHGR